MHLHFTYGKSCPSHHGVLVLVHEIKLTIIMQSFTVLCMVLLQKRNLNIKIIDLADTSNFLYTPDCNNVDTEKSKKQKAE